MMVLTRVSAGTPRHLRFNSMNPRGRLGCCFYRGPINGDRLVGSKARGRGARGARLRRKMGRSISLHVWELRYKGGERRASNRQTGSATSTPGPWLARARNSFLVPMLSRPAGRNAMHLGSRSFARPIQNRGPLIGKPWKRLARWVSAFRRTTPDKDRTVRSSRENKLVEKSREDKVIDTISH